MQAVRNWLRGTVDEFCRFCDRFKDESLKEIVEGTPTPQQLAEHRTATKLVLRSLHRMHAEVSDPDLPSTSSPFARELAAALEIRLKQFEALWSMIHDPLPSAESAEILRKHFPE